MNTRVAGIAPGSRFNLLWIGDSLTSAGTALMEFALGAWVYAHSGSVTAFAGMLVAATWPPILFLLIAGGLADRIERKYIIVGADLVLDLLVVALILLYASDMLQPLHLYVFNFVASIAASFRQPAYQAAVTDLLTKDKFTRASGLMGLSRSMSGLVAPLLGGVLVAAVGLGGVLTINLICFTCGTLFVLKSFARLPALRHAVNSGAQPTLLTSAVLKNLAAGAAFFRLQPLMIGLLVYATVQSSLNSLAILMVTPLVLAGHGIEQLGLISAFGAMGGASGAALLIAMRNPKRLMPIVIAANVLLSIAVLGIGLAHSMAAYCALAFMALTCASAAEGCVNALWMRKMPERFRASIFSLVGTLTLATMTAMMLGGGFAVDHLLEPALAPDGALAHSVGEWLGTGHGRGIALLFVGCGAIGVVLCAIALACRPLRQLDLRVPDEAQQPVSDSDKPVGANTSTNTATATAEYHTNA